MKPTLHLLGIRHHGPGSAASALSALQHLQPDLILLEGPPEADAILALAAMPDMRPPVAQLVYAVDNPTQAVFFPYTEFSPEWQTVQFAQRAHIPLRYFDLPQSHALALQADEDDADQADRADPLSLLAASAGFSDGERWWEYLVEHRANDLTVFEAIHQAMCTVREQLVSTHPPSRLEMLREAWMRKAIRQAQKEGFQTIAIVCGAWHTPALSQAVKVKDDQALLRGLPKLKTAATWAPWTHSRIAAASGYRAGVQAPGWYLHLWRQRQSRSGANSTHDNPGRRIAVTWLSRVAQALRVEGLDVSSASVIEAVRLAETLAALRGLPLPGLEELTEVSGSVFCFGDATALQLIHTPLVIGTELGQTPAEAPSVPLARDLEQTQKRLRLPPSAVEKTLELDLRQPLALERSQLLYRLGLLNIPWGERRQSSGKGTFKESWQVQWQPEFAIRLIEAARWGNSVAQAAAQCVREQLDSTTTLADIVQILSTLLLANLPTAVEHALRRLAQEAALANDTAQLMAALPELARILRYSDVRNTDTRLLAHIVQQLSARICSGLPLACASLDDTAAQAMQHQLIAVNDALQLLQTSAADKQAASDNQADAADTEPAGANNELAASALLTDWHRTLLTLADQHGLHGLLVGRCCRLLLNAQQIEPEQAAVRLQFALSGGVPAEQAAAWLDGFLGGGGALLLYDAKVWSIVDTWLCSLDPKMFQTLLPLLRRTFAGFAFGERRQLLEKVQTQPAGKTAIPASAEAFDPALAAACLPLLSQLLGLQEESP